jgi:hypothetical protein
MSETFSQKVLDYITKNSLEEKRIGDVFESLYVFSESGDIERLVYFSQEVLNYSDAKKIDYYQDIEKLHEKCCRRVVENKLEKFYGLMEDHFVFNKNLNGVSELIFEMKYYLKACSLKDRKALEKKVKLAEKTYRHSSSGLR